VAGGRLGRNGKALADLAVDDELDTRHGDGDAGNLPDDVDGAAPARHGDAAAHGVAVDRELEERAVGDKGLTAADGLLPGVVAEFDIGGMRA